mgnify:CR=1 FL=1
MAQTGSAQREPSMEEILASIRRIIEDSDSVRQPLEEPAELRVVSPAVEEQAPATDEVQAFRAELDEAVEAVAEEVTEQVAEPAAPAVEAPVEPQAREMPQVQLSAEELTDVDVQKAVEAVSAPQAAAPQVQPVAAAAPVSVPAGDTAASITWSPTYATTGAHTLPLASTARPLAGPGVSTVQVHLLGTKTGTDTFVPGAYQATVTVRCEP